MFRSFQALRAAVAAAIDGAGTEGASAGSIFNALPAELRRPVEVFGLMQLAAVLGELDELDLENCEAAETVRADGTRRRLRLPTVAFGERHREGLAAVGGEDD